MIEWHTNCLLENKPMIFSWCQYTRFKNDALKSTYNAKFIALYHYAKLQEFIGVLYKVYTLDYILYGVFTSSQLWRVIAWHIPCI